MAQIHARRCWRDRDIAEAHRSAIARFVDWLRNALGQSGLRKWRHTEDRQIFCETRQVYRDRPVERQQALIRLMQ